MASPGTLIGAAGLALQAGGALSAYSAAQKAAAARRATSEFEAEQLEQNATQSIATANRAMFETERQGAYTASRAQAVAAASGGSATDPTVINTIATLAGETAYRKSVDLYQGEEKARQLRLSAQATRLTGEIGAEANINQGNAALIQAAAGIASTVARNYWYAGPSTMYSRYGNGGPSVPGDYNTTSSSYS